MNKEERDSILESSLQVLHGLIKDVDEKTRDEVSQILVNCLVRSIDNFVKSGVLDYRHADTMGSYVIYFLQQFMNTPAVQTLHVRFFSSAIVAVIGGYSQAMLSKPELQQQAPSQNQEVGPNGGT